MASGKVTQALKKKLFEIAKGMGRGSVNVGFLENATYPDGTPVAAVAFWNEFGKEHQPPRPFFRQMISKESPGWPKSIASLAKVSNYNGHEVLKEMGDQIKDSLQQSIIDLTSPGLAESTKRKKRRGMTGTNKGLEMLRAKFGANVGPDKPLIDTGDMLRSVNYEVED